MFAARFSLRSLALATAFFALAAAMICSDSSELAVLAGLTTIISPFSAWIVTRIMHKSKYPHTHDAYLAAFSFSVGAMVTVGFAFGPNVLTLVLCGCLALWAPRTM